MVVLRVVSVTGWGCTTCMGELDYMVSSWKVPARCVVLQNVIEEYWLVAWDREVRGRGVPLLWSGSGKEMERKRARASWGSFQVG
jgi:hypothetical protein